MADFNADNFGDHIERAESARHAAGILPAFPWFFKAHPTEQVSRPTIGQRE